MSWVVRGSRAGFELGVVNFTGREKGGSYLTLQVVAIVRCRYEARMIPSRVNGRHFMVNGLAVQDSAV